MLLFAYTFRHTDGEVCKLTNMELKPLILTDPIIHKYFLWLLTSYPVEQHKTRNPLPTFLKIKIKTQNTKTRMLLTESWKYTRVAVRQRTTWIEDGRGSENSCQPAAEAVKQRNVLWNLHLGRGNEGKQRREWARLAENLWIESKRQVGWSPLDGEESSAFRGSEREASASRCFQMPLRWPHAVSLTNTGNRVTACCALPRRRFEAPL